MMLKTGNKGFTLIEVMLATVILSLGSVLIQEGLLRSATLIGRCEHTLTVQRWMDQKIWKTKESILYDPEGDGASESGSGTFLYEGKEFSWDLEADAQDSSNSLYLIKLSVSWNEGGRPIHLTKAMLAAKIEKIP